MNTEDRLEAMESKLAFTEVAMNELNDALIAQQERMDTLERQIVVLNSQLSQLGEDNEPIERTDPEHDRPPHY